MPPGDLAPVIVVGLLITAIAAVLILRGPLGRALARRLEETSGRTGVTDAGIASIVERVNELEQPEGRLAELEERLDFAERLLAQRDTERLPRGRDE